MIEDKIKSILGELLMQNAILQHQIEDLTKQLKDKEKDVSSRPEQD